MYWTDSVTLFKLLQRRVEVFDSHGQPKEGKVLNVPLAKGSYIAQIGYNEAKS